MTSGRGHMIDILFTLALFCVFAATALMVVLIGANVYRSTVHSMDRNYDSRTSFTYVCNKIKQNDAESAVLVADLDGITALVLEQDTGESVFQTWIYCYDGQLKEILVRQGVEFDPEDGQTIMDLGGFSVEQLENRSLLLTSTDLEGNRTSMFVTPRCAV